MTTRRISVELDENLLNHIGAFQLVHKCASRSEAVTQLLFRSINLQHSELELFERLIHQANLDADIRRRLRNHVRERLGLHYIS